MFVAAGMVLTVAAAPALADSSVWRYEMVSPLAKNGVGVFASHSPNYGIGGISNGGFQLTPDGNALLFTAAGALPGAEGGPAFTRYVGRRMSSDWDITSVDPPTKTDTTFLRTQMTFALSDDGVRAVVFSNEALAPGAVDAGQNVYIRDLVSGSYELVGTGLGNWSDIGADISLAAVTHDLGSLFFSSSSEWRASSGLGEMTVQPAGEPHPINAHLTSTLVPTVTPDGSAKLLTPNDSFGTYASGIYLVRDGAAPVQVTASQRAGDDPAQRQPAYFIGASGDLSTVFFFSPVPLTDDSDTGDPGAPDDTLYRYDARTGRLTDLLANVRPGERVLSAVLGRVSADGSTLFFQAQGAFAPGAPAGTRNLYVVRDGELRFVADLGNATDLNPGSNQISPDGRYFTLQASANLTAYDSSGPGCATASNPLCSQIFVYDTVERTMSCASCDPDGSPPKGYALFRPSQVPGLRHLSNVLTDDGKVAFESSDALVPADVNGRRDVYTWQAGRLELISTGRGDSDTLFEDMSADGSTIALATRQQLVGRDTDQLVDAYVARIGGGLPSQGASAPRPPVCRGADCQGFPTAPPTLVRSGSEDLSGTGQASGGTQPKPSSIAIGSKTMRGGSATVRVALSGAGVLEVSGRGVATASVRAAGRGVVAVRLALRSAARRTLRSTGRLSVRLDLRFTPRTGKKSHATTRLNFRSTQRRRGHGRTQANAGSRGTASHG
ncbi:hypothetical protein Q7L71_01315 [Conexibacter sp. CPCC 205706]|uniref:hypothetical protein n=1 Tax=Conexibacter sp. CPCC 205706 TaxID=3064572 RepID=UPI00271A049A|nr:hypothetical protein [Conexibacter sp. CPCC 205706]MDO8184198.1 hypothetical protein [Conexibacter sp. CPCC 205706]